MTLWNLGQDVCRQICKVKQDRFSTGKCENVGVGWPAGYLLSGPSILWTFFKFPNFLRSYVLPHSETREATCTFIFC